jgi:translocation and assembly module TamA
LRKTAFLLAAVGSGALATATAAAAQSSPAPADRAAQAAAREAQALQTPPPADGPIVTDSQFEEELPPLDPELNRPLEPLEDFAIDEAPTVTPQGEIVADAPVPDPELTRPLTPISEFDVRVPEPGTEAAEDQPGPVEPVRYSLAIEGLEEVELEDRFRELSALEDADGEATNGSQVAQRAKEDEALAVRLLRSEGYYDATAASAIEQVPDDPAGLRVILTAVPGPRYNFGAIVIDGPETEPAGLVREALPLKSGDPIVALNVEAAEANVRLKLPQQGYPFAEVGLRDILLDPDTRLGDYTLPVETGPRSRFAGFTTEGNLAFSAKHVGVLSRFKRGELNDHRKVDDLREAMIATGLFTTVAAEPVRTGEKAEDGAEYVNILVRQEAGPPRSLSANAGFSTGEGLRIEGTWEHRNFFPPEGAIRATAIAGTQEQAVRFQFRRSNFHQRDRTLLIQAEAGRRDYAAFRGYTARLSGLLSRESTPIWQKKWTYAVGGELIATNESVLGEPRLSIGDAFFLAGLTAQLGYDASNSLLDPTKGFRLLGRINPETSLRDPSQPYIRNILEGSAYFPAAENITLAGRARVGSIYGAELIELAPSRRLYAGGGGSVRGFGFQELGPKIELPNPKFDPEDEDEKDDPTIFRPTGGRSLVEFAVEARYRFGNYGVVGFVDAGQVYQSQSPRLNDMRFGVGVGGRLYTNFGPLRADIAMPVGRRKGESRFAVYVSIGQAF